MMLFCRHLNCLARPRGSKDVNVPPPLVALLPALALAALQSPIAMTNVVKKRTGKVPVQGPFFAIRMMTALGSMEETDG